jgi:hypothetical protein
LVATSPSFSQTNKLVDTKTFPVNFEVNRGQASTDIQFVARAESYTVYIRAGRATFHLHRSNGYNVTEKDTRKNIEVGMSLVGANEQPEVRPEGQLPGYSNFLFGPDPSKWIRGVAQYAKVCYSNVYPGIDVLYRGNQGRIENDFVVLPFRSG